MDLRCPHRAADRLLAAAVCWGRHQAEYRRCWLPGQAHSVVYLGNLTDDLLIVGDPTVGRELWRRHELRTLWTGRGLRLVPRDAATTDSLLAAQQ